MSALKRGIIVVLDSLGVGELPDAAEYGDVGSNTLVNTASYAGGLSLPNLNHLGLCNIASYPSKIQPPHHILGNYGKLREASKGKDTTTGHWEMMGVVLEHPFPVFPQGFPEEVMMPFEKAIGRKVLGNQVASGTQIIEKLGKEHMETGFPIIYTSADSVFQIAAHEDIIPIDALYEMCLQARRILKGEYEVGRVIARPFVGEPGSFVRTPNRKDFSRKPPHDTFLDMLKADGKTVAAVGKIEDIFAGQGITEAIHTKDDQDGIEVTLKFMEQVDRGVIFTNLVNFDAQFGHRNDAEGYGRHLEEIDEQISRLIQAGQPGDLIIFTGDHGCDPTTPSTDHSREYTPLLVYGKDTKQGVDLGIRETFADIAATFAEGFGMKWPYAGKSFWQEILLEK